MTNIRYVYFVHIIYRLAKSAKILTSWKNVWLAQSSLNSCLCNHLKVVFLGPIILAWHREIASVVPTLRAHFVQSQAKRGLATGKEGGGGGLAWNGNELDAKRELDASGRVGQDIYHTDRLFEPVCMLCWEKDKQKSLNSSTLRASTAWAYQLN